MENEDFSEKVENTVVGLIQFVLRLGRTLQHLITKPGRLLAEVRNNFENRQYLAPHAYLLSCAIALGFFGKILAEGLAQAGIGSWENIKSLTFTSFINHSVPVFGIAVAAALLVEILLVEQQPERKQHFKNLNFYVIGFFGIGSIGVLLLLSGLLNLTFDQFGSGTDVFVIGSTLAIGGYICAMLWLLYWLTSNAIRGKNGPNLSWTLSARILLINVIVISLCALHFVSPLYQLDEGAPALKGRKIDLAKQSDGSLRLTFLLENISDTDVVISQFDDITVVAEIEESKRVEAKGRFCLAEVTEKPEQGFLLLAPAKSDILTACVMHKPLNALLEEFGFVAIAREHGGRNYLPSREQNLRFSIIIRFNVGDRRDDGRPIEL